MAKTDTKEVAVADESTKEVAVAQVQGGPPAEFLEDMAEYAGAGASERAQDYSMPFLAVLQKGSPQVNKRDPKYVRGAEAGMFLNTATLDLYQGEGEEDDQDRGVVVVPAHFLICYVEWVPRSAGGGYVATHPIDTPLLKSARKGEKGGLTLPNGNDLVETAYYFCIAEATMDQVVIGFSSTGLATNRQWQTLMQRNKVRNKEGSLVRAPGFSHRFRLTTKFLKNDSGDWFGVGVADLGWVTDRDVYEAAKSFYKVVSSPDFTMGRPADAADMSGAGAPLDDNLPI